MKPKMNQRVYSYDKYGRKFYHTFNHLGIPYDSAVKWVEQMNKEYPQIQHFMETAFLHTYDDPGYQHFAKWVSDLKGTKHEAV